jgi:hypothetical protein
MTATQTAPQTRQTTAFFYQQPEVLDRSQHQGLRLRPADARFAAQAHAVPLLAVEFPEAALEFPIVFSQGSDGRWLALALTALRNGENAFVDAQGRWTARCVPASLRRYPFILAESGEDQLSLAVDRAAPHLGDEGEGQPLFDAQGEPTALARDVLSSMADFQQQAQRTHALIGSLSDAGLLAQQDLRVQLADGREAVVAGVWLVDEARLRALPDDQALAWFRSGQLAAVHAQLLSLRNLVGLLARSGPAGDGAVAADAVADSAATAEPPKPTAAPTSAPNTAPTTKAGKRAANKAARARH